ncbi:MULTISPECIES: NAD(P)/FAD-dependent oxidoreductase [Niallia]|uniref:flavin-containing monooxygenase n=1 Tax=Niallia TaxID=2837506 RepID=UPI0015F75125|nr:MULTISPECIES: NAD(P)/FAD-dependent oxidoreductase [Niallia]UPO91241.1 NAD(P)/FAD-dependent oxidoreductase [Niallia sp. Man26]GKU85101.1 oxidoreductase [Niallia sp. NCCP-28]
MGKIYDAIVVGGGQAGLAAGYYLKKNKLQYLILDSSNQARGSWPDYYDSLKLFSPASFASLPGLKFPKHANEYPSRFEVIKYLEDYIQFFQFPIEGNQQVVSVEKEDEIFTLITEKGNRFQSKTIINATGSFRNPYIPDIKGIELFKGRIFHSSEYRNPTSFINKRNIVVGSGNSAVQIAIELSEISITSLAVRNKVKLLKQKVLGLDLHYWIRITGFDNFPFWRFRKSVPQSNSVIDLGNYKEKIKEGNPDQKRMFTSFYSDGVVWADGSKEPVDTVIFATGYKSYLPHLADIGATDINGKPIHQAGVSTSVKGLYYVGLDGQRTFASATIRGVGPDSKFVVQKLLRFLKN